MITLQTNGSILSVQVTDALGRNVETLHATSLQDNRLNIFSLTQGLYWVKIKTAEGVAMQQVVKR